ncbi:fibronectin type III domain-containing protein [Paenibacillus sp. T2-29]|uniref:fibronectin type III domain-containing protein n=1 Tax=Paenibacillus TaxID=44249 RepID=UPI0039BC8AF1
MRIRFFQKICILFGTFLLVTVSLLNSNIYAASVGDRLTEPEVGWKRFDDTYKTILRENGVFAFVPSDEPDQAYKGGYYYSKDIGATISFAFTGEKVRILAPVWTLQSNNIEVNIDGVKITNYSANGSPVKHRVILFEKLNLDKGKHIVKLTNNQAGNEFEVDAIDIAEDGELLPINAPFNLDASAGDSKVILKWEQIQNAESYTVKYGTESGKYTETATATKDAYGNFVIPGLTNGTKYYFVVSAKVNGVDSEYSNEASATPQGGGSQPDPEPTTGDRAILVVTMTTGLEKEFDLSMKEVNDFISWYEGKQAGSGSASYAINKHDNNKGPFSSRKDYMLFDRILTFEVSEYSK